MKRGRGQYTFIYATLLALIVVVGMSISSLPNQGFAATNDLATQLQVLKKLQTDGVITQEEFNQAKSILLDKDKEKTKTVIKFLETLEEDDDVQKLKSKL